MIKSNKPVEKTHFLDKLLAQILADYPSLAKIQDDILEINLYLPKLRYPSGDKIGFDEALAAYNKLGHINKTIRELL